MALSAKGRRAARTLGAAKAVQQFFAQRREDEKAALLREDENRKIAIQQGQFAEKLALDKQTAKDTKEFNLERLGVQREDLKEKRALRADQEKQKQNARNINKIKLIFAKNKGAPITEKQKQKMIEQYPDLLDTIELLSIAHNQTIDAKETEKFEKRTIFSFQRYQENPQSFNSFPFTDKQIEVLVDNANLKPIYKKDGVTIDFTKTRARERTALLSAQAKELGKSPDLTTINLGKKESGSNIHVNIDSTASLTAMKEFYKDSPEKIRAAMIRNITTIDDAVNDMTESEIFNNKKQIETILYHLITSADAYHTKGKTTLGTDVSYYLTEDELRKFAPKITGLVDDGKLQNVFDILEISDKKNHEVVKKFHVGDQIFKGEVPDELSHDLIVSPLIMSNKERTRTKILGKDILSSKGIKPNNAIGFLIAPIDQNKHITGAKAATIKELQANFNSLKENPSVNKGKIEPMIDALKSLDPSLTTTSAALLISQAILKTTRPRVAVKDNGTYSAANNDKLKIPTTSVIEKAKTASRGIKLKSAEVIRLVTDIQMLSDQMQKDRPNTSPVSLPMGVAGEVKGFLTDFGAVLKDIPKLFTGSFQESVGTMTFKVQTGFDDNGQPVYQNFTKDKMEAFIQKQALAEGKDPAVIQQRLNIFRNTNNKLEIEWNKLSQTNINSRDAKLRKLILLKKMALTYRLSGLFQGDSSGRTISNQDYEVAAAALWGETYSIGTKMEDLKKYFEATRDSADFFLNNIDTGLYDSHLNEIQSVMLAKRSKEFTQKLLREGDKPFSGTGDVPFGKQTQASLIAKSIFTDNHNLTVKSIQRVDKDITETINKVLDKQNLDNASKIEFVKKNFMNSMRTLPPEIKKSIDDGTDAFFTKQRFVFYTPERVRENLNLYKWKQEELSRNIRVQLAKQFWGRSIRNVLQQLDKQQ